VLVVYLSEVAACSRFYPLQVVWGGGDGYKWEGYNTNQVGIGHGNSASSVPMR
jgi:hypothetical protein